MEEQNKDLEHKLEESEKKVQEYLDNWKRERADFINYKKEEIKRIEEFIKFTNENVFLEVIDLIDDLEISIKHSDADQNGLKQILKKFIDWLKKYGMEKIKVEGEKFDPLLHEAVESNADGDKMEEVRSGYTMRGKVIRPARVKIVNQASL